jgi:hypothetical protein
MTTRQELHYAIDQLSEEQLQKVIQLVEAIQPDLFRTSHRVDFVRCSGVLQLTEDPLTYQERLRNEWPQLIVLAPEEDDAGLAWARGIANEWSTELGDIAQDIYTLEDGQPVNGPV